ncbi:MAG: PAS domain S-box protein [Myxococcales bacterium]|nr:PAS domain S-box protein [Myxococcales bacterium]
MSDTGAATGTLHGSDPERDADRQARALLKLSETVGQWGADVDAALARITETASQALGVERAGVWFFDGRRESIRCADVYWRSDGSHASGDVLRRAEHPAYFEAIASERAVAAGDAAKDPRTREFADGYLAEYGIGAMLDTPVHHGGQVVGILCLEHVGGPREWTVAERFFAASLGDFVGLALTEHQRSEAEAALRAREEQLRLLNEHASDLIGGLDAEGRFTYLSPNHREALGLAPEGLLGTDAFDLVHPDDVERAKGAFEAGLDTGATITLRYRLARADGSWVWYEGAGRTYRGADGRPASVVASRDITDRLAAERAAKELQAQLSQAQRLEAVGRLAGGIAHDFNNLLTAILGHLEVAQSDPKLRDGSPAGQALRDELAEASSAALRAAELTRQLLALGRNQAIEAELVDVNAALESLGRMIRRVIGEDVRLVAELSPAVPAIRIDPTQLDQVLMNLAINCRDAMPHGGVLRVATSVRDLDPAFVTEHVGARIGRHVCIEGRDSGVGMDRETRARVFDPFFTTKEVGKGAGLGLSTVYQIVREARGVIELESQLDAGTCVRIFLPAIEDATGEAPDVAGEPAVRAERRETPEPEPARASGAGQRVLVVEDEDAVRRLLERALRAQGHDVVTAANGREALARMAEIGDDVALVVSDVVMPVMGGIELARRLAQTHPELKLLMLSGYAPPQPDGADADVLRRDRVLQKPFTTRRLIERVQALLDEPTDPAR